MVGKENVKLMTRRGFEALAAEHKNLLTKERPKVVKGVQIAAAEGDRSENAEYIYGKKRLREIDKRLGYLTKLLRDVKVVDPEKIVNNRVCFGATVKVRDEKGEEHCYKVVGEGEPATQPKGRSSLWVSHRSPMALALMGKQVNDIVVVERPAGETELEVLEIFFVAD